jgi:hypothetical protein
MLLLVLFAAANSACKKVASCRLQACVVLACTKRLITLQMLDRQATADVFSVYT